MEAVMENYLPTLWAFGAMGGMMLLQILVIDVISIRRHHPPGTAVNSDHADALFRATRVLGNTNESIAIFILLSVFAVMSAAAPNWVNGLVWLYVVARTAHMLFYYLNLKILRSVAFSFVLVALAGLLLAGLVAVL